MFISLYINMIHSIKFYFISIAFLSKVRVGKLHCVNFCINNVDDFMFRVSDLLTIVYSQ